MRMRDELGILALRAIVDMAIAKAEETPSDKQFRFNSAIAQAERQVQLAQAKANNLAVYARRRK